MKYLWLWQYAVATGVIGMLIVLWGYWEHKLIKSITEETEEEK